MESIDIPNAILNSGQSMPLIGMGMAVSAFDPSESAKAAVRAIELGYRHFDTASLYRTEQFLGEAIVEALRLGLIKSRDELFITSKLWCSDAHPDLVLPALQKSLQNLQLEYLDLYLVHWPVSSKHGKHEYPIPKEELMPMDFKAVWAAMEECQRLGLTKSIGVSNFSIKKLEDLLAMATIPPSVNQVEMNPLWQQKKLREYCKDKGILVAAYSPLGATGAKWGSNRVVENEVLNEIAKAKGKTVAQVSLRWGFEKGVSVVVKSFNEKRMKENLAIFDWALSEEEHEKINQILHQRRNQTGEDFVSDNGPYKTLSELWDDDF